MLFFMAYLLNLTKPHFIFQAILLFYFISQCFLKSSSSNLNIHLSISGIAISPQTKAPKGAFVLSNLSITWRYTNQTY